MQIIQIVVVFLMFLIVLSFRNFIIVPIFQIVIIFHSFRVRSLRFLKVVFVATIRSQAARETLLPATTLSERYAFRRIRLYRYRLRDAALRADRILVEERQREVEKEIYLSHIARSLDY